MTSRHGNMGLLTNVQNCGLRMRRECREHFPRCRLQRKPLVCDPGMHHGKCVTHVPWCMSGSLIRCSGENIPGIPGACATRNFAYMVRGSFPHCGPFAWGIHRPTMDSTHKRSNYVELWCVFLCVSWTRCWTNNRVAGDFRHYDAHMTSR